MIRVLEKNVADKIAAGEVVERPVSIVKELVENAVDSGADSIVVEIRHGGKDYIRVTDSGCGIPAEETEIAFLRHATSKIQSANDLDAIETLGFRGEALASIAAVTRIEFVTKTSEEKMGTRILIHGGEILEKKGTGCPDGTTIIVTDLFYNTPARRKFLKSDSAESSRIIEFMSQIALAYPKIRFRFINSGNIVFSTDGRGDLFSTILSVYRMNEYKDLVPVSMEAEGSRVTGYISRPSLSKNSRKSQVFFVNGRVIRSKVIEKGLAEGYRERLFEGRYPVAFLFIYTDPASLDVNIHPNKKEIRFDKEQQMTDLVAAAVRSALGTKAAVTEVKNPFKDHAAEKISQKNESSTEQIDIKQILSTKRKSLKIQEDQTPYVLRQTAEEVSGAAAGIVNSETESDLVPLTEGSVQTGHSQQNGGTENNARLHCVKPAVSIEEPALQPFSFEDLTLTGSVFNTYITAVDSSNFYLIDQHAAHERVFYEKLVGAYLSEEKLRQPILTPILLEVPLSVKADEYDWLDSLEDLGFLLEEFGPNSYRIREIPTFMTISEAEDFAGEFIDGVSAGVKSLNTVVINKLIMKSCKSAVKAHDKLSEDEMKALIRQLAACRNPFSCPHGRPTFIRLSKYEIEKMFKRV